MPRLSVPMEYALKVLEDGNWYPLDWAIWEISRGVPPNLAFRKAEKSRVKQYLRDHPEVTREEDVPPRTKNKNMDRLVGIGAKDIAREILRNAAFEHIQHKETGQRMVRRFRVGGPPIPQGYERWGNSQSTFAGKTEEEVRKALSDRTHRAVRSRLQNQGIDPDTYITRRQQQEERARWWASLSPEERRKIRSEITRKGWETRKKKEGG